MLRELRTHLSDPTHWTKGCYARDAEGEPVNVREGVCHCLVGACILLAPDTETLDALTNRLRRFVGPLTIFNDHPDTTHADILALIDRAIAA